VEETKSLSVPFWIRHSKVALQTLSGRTTTLVTHDHDRNLTQTSGSTNDSGIITERAIAVKLYEIGEDELDVIKGKGAIEVSRELNSLIRSELTVYILSDLRNLAFECRVLFTTGSVSARQLILQALKLIL
jgi:hypothetical protein